MGAELKRERELYAGIQQQAGADPLYRLEVFTTGLTTDGRFMKIRGTLRNPFPEVVDGVRVMVSIFTEGPGTSTAAKQTFQDDKSLRINAGDDAPLRFDVETMYAAGEGSFRVEAFAKKVGEHDIPPPPGWEE